MKAQFLKIAKCKDEKAFYKKYPTEAAFFKAHPEAKASIKKAQIGMTIAGGVPANTNKYVNYQNVYNDVYQQYTGIDIEEEQKLQREAQINAQAIKEASKKEGAGGAGGGIMSMLKGLLGGEEGGEGGEGGEGFGEDIIPTGTDIMAGGDLSMAARYGRNIPKAQVGVGVGGASPGNFNSWDIDNNGVPDTIQQVEGNPLMSSENNSGGGFSAFMDKAENVIGKGLPIVGPIISGAQALKQKKEVAKAAKQAKEVSELGLIASGTRPERIENKYNEPFDSRVGIDQLSKSYGVGTNVLTRNGGRIRQAANGTEIQNTYAPGTLYDDLGYEPLNDHYKLKQYYGGGYIPRAEGGGGFSAFMNEGGGAGVASGLNKSLFDNSGESQIGSGIGQGLGMLIPGVGGPIGSAVGGMLGGIYGKLFPTPDGKRDVEKTQRNIQGMAMNNMASQVRSPYTAYTKNGGNVNPQLINRFNELDAQDFAEFAHQDEFRAGGHLKSYTPPSERAMETYAMGGQLKTHWGGKAKTMSYNPYMPGSGETVVFRGQSHTESDKEGNTGIGITYGESPVEVERGEPMFEMQSGGEVDPQTGETENTGVVFGNMQVDKKIAGQLDDPDLMEIANKYHGKKFKTIGIELAKQEAKQNKIIDKNTKVLDSFKVETSLDKAKLAGIRANMEGADTKLRNIANTKITLANYQNAINDAKDELSDAIGQNLSAEDLAKGYTKLDKDPVTMDAKWGGNIVKKAQNGEITPKKTRKFKTIRQANAAGYYEDENGNLVRRKKKFSIDKEETKSADALDNVPAGQKQSASGLWGKVTQEAFDAAKKDNPWFDWNGFDPKDKKDVLAYQRAFNARAKANNSKAEIEEDGDFGDQTVTARIYESKKSTPVVDEEELTATLNEPGETPMEEEKTKFPWGALANTILPFLRPSDVAGLDMAQLYPEMFALSSNQLEPVPAQGYSPDLGTPYDISFQDQLNANQADFNSTKRMVGYNPAVQGLLDAQKYAANTGVLGSQFRANQEMKDKVYGENRNILNQSKVTNLDIYDRQYGRQAEARSNTKATTQAALNSISDKYAKNKLENRKLSIYENMYNYRFGKSGRAQSYNPLQFFDYSGSGSSDKSGGLAEGKEFTYDRYGNIVGVRSADKDTTDDDLEAVGGIKNKNGGYTKIKSKNGSILRDFKNL